VVGIVANLNWLVQRVDLFLRAAHVIADVRPGSRFVVVGDKHLRPAQVELCSEGLSNSILKYMAAGATTVARSGGGKVELVANVETGVLGNRDDPRPGAGLVPRLFSDAAHWQRMSRRARETARRSPSFNESVARPLGYYRDLLSESWSLGATFLRRRDL
jgi:hypothetical protein